MDDGRSMVVTDTKERQKALAAALAQAQPQEGALAHTHGEALGA